MTDPGTFSAALEGGDGLIVAYLNATPQGGSETAANWARFRPEHLSGEGARDVRVIAAAAGLPFRSGHGSCTIDAYATSRTNYREIACLVAGLRASTVIVGAVQPGAWAAQSPVIERAIAGFAT